MTPLRQQMIDTMLLHGFTQRTQNTYLSGVESLVRYTRQSPDSLSLQQIEQWLLYLVKERQLAPASCRLYFNSVSFLFTRVLKRDDFVSYGFTLPKNRQQIPTLLNPHEVAAIVSAPPRTHHRMMLILCYGCGLRVNELVHVRVSDIDGYQQLLRITQGKGNKDRLVPIGMTLLRYLQQYWLRYRPQDFLFKGKSLTLTSEYQHPRSYSVEQNRSQASTNQAASTACVMPMPLIVCNKVCRSINYNNSLGIRIYSRLCVMHIGYPKVVKGVECLIYSLNYHWPIMSRLSMQQVLTRFLPDLQQQQALSHQQLTVCRHLQQCRTATMGGFVYCGHETTLYHACHNRHCTRCQQQATQQWCDKQASHLLPVTYYHLVFTLPHALNGWVRLHPRLIYALLFRVVWQTLSCFGKNPKHLGGELGMSAIMHTWGQTLDQHVHLHCLIPGGAFGSDGKWREAKSTYLFPVRALSRVYRGKMVSALRDAANEGKLSRVTRPNEINTLLNSLMQKSWVVFAKPCLQHTRSVIDYLGRYTHRIALSDSRLSYMDEETVSFHYRDYRDDGKKVMTLSGTEFLRRFLQHVLPKGFMRVRHFGWLANASRAKKLPLMRIAIVEETNLKPHTSHESTEQIVERFTGLPCPCCQKAVMFISALLKPQRLEGG